MTSGKVFGYEVDESKVSYSSSRFTLKTSYFLSEGFVATTEFREKVSEKDRVVTIKGKFEMKREEGTFTLTRKK